MKKRYDEFVPYPMWDRPCQSMLTDTNNFDPLGSYTGLVKDPYEEPVQDADDL